LAALYAVEYQQYLTQSCSTPSKEHTTRRYNSSHQPLHIYSSLFQVFILHAKSVDRNWSPRWM